MFRHFLRNRNTCIQVLPCGDIMNDERNRNCIGETGPQLAGKNSIIPFRSK